MFIVLRFIDHTLATPWETLVSDIELALRNFRSDSPHKVDIYYFGLTYKLEKRRSSSTSKREISRGFLWLSTTYNINWFILFSHATQSNDYHCSQRATVLSAFVTALKNYGNAHGISVPAFFSYSYITDISKCADLIGYQLLGNHMGTRSSTQHMNAAGEAAIAKPRWCRYESHVCMDFPRRYDLAFFDGLRRIFQSRLSSLRLAGSSGDAFFIETDFSFQYQLHDIYGHLAAHPAKPTAQILGAALFKPDFIKRVSDIIPSDEVVAIMLSDVEVGLKYRIQPHNSIIDNVNFTTYVPSKQPPHCWSLRTVYAKLPIAQVQALLDAPHSQTSSTSSSNGAPRKDLGGMNNFPGLLRFGSPEVGLSASWLSQCVRKLLAFYLLAVQCTRKKINVETMSAEVAATEALLDKPALEHMLEVLSAESKEVFFAICKQQIEESLIPPSASGDILTATPTVLTRKTSLLSDPGTTTLSYLCYLHKLVAYLGYVCHVLQVRKLQLNPPDPRCPHLTLRRTPAAPPQRPSPGFLRISLERMTGARAVTATTAFSTSSSARSASTATLQGLAVLGLQPCIHLGRLGPASEGAPVDAV